MSYYHPRGGLFCAWMAILAVVLALIMGFALAGMGQDIPEPAKFPQSVIDHNPFADNPSFAKDLYVANVAELSEVYLVTIASTTDPDFRKYLYSTVPDEDGFKVVAIFWSEKLCATRVVIAKEQQFASIGFLEECGVMYSDEPTPARPWPFNLLH